jgi:beta-phosphoglucomutase family hydrolase
MLRATIFDMDGLLIDSEVLWDEMNTGFFARRGVKYNFEIKKPTIGRREVDIVDYFKKTYSFFTDSPEALLKERHEAISKLFKERIRLMPGAAELLERFKKDNVPMALASSSIRSLVQIAVDKLGLAQYLQEIVTGDLVKKGKPDPEIFLLAAEKLGVPPAECVVFEDASSGVAAAHAAGMKAVAVPHATSPREILREADLIINRLDEFSFDKLK